MLPQALARIKPGKAKELLRSEEFFLSAEGGT
jgi:hypothetical protein